MAPPLSQTAARGLDPGVGEKTVCRVEGANILVCRLGPRRGLLTSPEGGGRGSLVIGGALWLARAHVSR